MDIKHFSEGYEYYSHSSFENYTSKEETVMYNSLNSSKNSEKYKTSAIKRSEDTVSKKIDIEKIISNIKNIYI